MQIAVTGFYEIREGSCGMIRHRTSWHPFQHYNRPKGRLADTFVSRVKAHLDPPGQASNAR